LTGGRVRFSRRPRPTYSPLSPTPFRELREHELTQLPDERLIAYIAGARAGGKTDAMTAAVRILAHGYYAIVENRVRLKVPKEHVADVTHDAITSAMTAAFDGESVGEFRSWLHTITQRRVADFHRSREGRPDTVPLPSHGDEGAWGDEIAVEFEGVSIDAERAIDTAMGELSEVHAEAIDMNVFEDLPAGKVAAQLGLTEQNVHQIKSRFKKRVRELLDEGDTAG